MRFGGMNPAATIQLEPCRATIGTHQERLVGAALVAESGTGLCCTPLLRRESPAAANSKHVEEVA